MTNALIAELHDAIITREPVVMAVVVDSEQSVPRRPGSKMLVYPDGRISGSVGGGEMESRVIEASLELFGTGRPERISYSLVDPTEGDPGVCGGMVELYLEPHLPQPMLFVIGPAEFGEAIAELAAWVGFGASTARASEIDVATIDEYTMTVVVADGPEGLTEVVSGLLATSTAYIAVAGPARAWDGARERLLAGGHAATQLERVRAIAEIEIDPDRPAELALAVLADVIAHERHP